MIKIKGWVLVLVLMCSCLSIQAQDAVFSQYYSSELYLNPAMAGTEPYPTIGMNYRTQWSSIVIPYNTSQVSLIYPLEGKKNVDNHFGGVGLSLYQDVAGDGRLSTTGVNVNCAYNVELSERSGGIMMSFGLQGGLIQKQIDFSKLQWGSQYNPYIGYDISINPGEANLTSSRMYPDIGAGGVFSYNYKQDFKDKPFSAFAGFAAYHLNRPNESLLKNIPSRLPVLYKLYSGLVFPLDEEGKLKVSPNVIAVFQGRMDQVNSGLYLMWRAWRSQKAVFEDTELIFGAWKRFNDSYIFSLGLNHQNYTVGFSFDYNDSNLRYSTKGRGAYELSLILRLVKEKKFRHIATPRI